MSIMDWFERLVKSEAVHYVAVPIPPERQDKPVQPTVIQAEKHYLRLWLAEMFLKDDRRLFREFVPVVHSAVRLQFAQNAAQELPYVAGPQDVGLGTTLGKGVQVDHPLTNLIPFRGGTVSVAAALVAYKRKDFFEGFMQVLNNVSGLLNAGQLSATLKVVEGAVAGIQTLLGAGDKEMHLLYFQGYGGSTSSGGASLTSGYTAVIRGDAGRFDTSRLWVKNGGLHYGDTLAAARPLDGYDSMLLRLESAIARDDFLSFEEFGKLLKEAIREGLRDRARGDAIIQTALVAAYESPDLTNADRLRVARALREEYDNAVGGGPAGPDTGRVTRGPDAGGPAEHGIALGIERVTAEVNTTRLRGGPGRTRVARTRGGRGGGRGGGMGLQAALERLDQRARAFDPHHADELMALVDADGHEDGFDRFLGMVERA
ncbi:MAG TPA: hypothetical protein VFJ16_15575 [Longimicrobium sp.]|nr:hypothetical protein [Longimicrobium sp.]